MMLRTLACIVVCSLLGACATGSEDFLFGKGGGNSQGGNDTPQGGGEVGGGDGGGTVPENCGNGLADDDEDCDGTDLETTSCLDLGFVGGELACSDVCEFDTSACLDTLCDNGVLDAEEECDGSQFGTSTCVTEGFAGGMLSCVAETCLVDSALCKPNLNEGFEGASLPIGWTSDNWLLDTSSFHAGTKSARSAVIDHNGVTGLRATVVFDAPGSITFWHRESAETGYDYLKLYIDGAQVAQYNVDAWQQASVPVTAGSHMFEWRFTKDGSISLGQDAIWVDDVIAIGGYLP